FGGSSSRSARSASACRRDGSCAVLGRGSSPASLIDIEEARKIGVLPQQLPLVRLLAHLGANLGKRVTDFHTRLGKIAQQRTGGGTVFTRLAIKRCLAGPGRKRYERTLAGLHLGKAG